MEELTKKDRRIGELFLDLGLITEAQLKRAIDLQKKDECFLGEALIRIGAISKDKLYWVLADQYNLPYISNLSSEYIDPDVVKSIPEEIARGYSILPVYSTDNELYVVIHNPTQTEILNSLKKMTGKHLKIAISNRESINNVLDEFYGISHARSQPMKPGLDIWSAYFEKPQLIRCINDISGKEFLNFILLAAELEGTPSIHLGIEGSEFLVKFRIEDKLFTKFKGPLEWHKIILNQLKTLANIQNDEDELIIKGRFEYEIKDEKITYRLTMVRGFAGEKIILNPLKGFDEFLTLDNLGMSDNQISLIRNRAQILPGLVLFVTSNVDVIPRVLSCLLFNLNLKNQSVITLEHDILFKNEQFIQIDAKDFTDERLLQTLKETASLDVDLLMIDNIKNPTILKEALNMAFRVPKIYGAMLQESMIKAIETFFRIGEDPTTAFLNTNLIIFQQSVPFLCPYCKETVTPESFSSLPNSIAKMFKLYKPVGCDRCNHTGYKGNIPFYEILPVTHEVRELAIMDMSIEERTQKVYDLISPKISDFIMEALEKGNVFWNDVRRILENYERPFSVS